MPRFFFHVCNGNGFTEDEEGRDLPDLDSARAEAIKGARSIMAEELQRGHLDLSSFIEIEDEAHNWLLTLTFQDAVRITSGEKSNSGGT